MLEGLPNSLTSRVNECTFVGGKTKWGNGEMNTCVVLNAVCCLNLVNIKLVKCVINDVGPMKILDQCVA